jgi:hypothetical protein
MKKLIVYCQIGSEGATSLVKKLEELQVPVKRLRTPVGLNNHVKEGDVVVSWGGYTRKGGHPNAIWLNEGRGFNKLKQLKMLQEKEVLVPSFSLSPVAGWLGRTADHHEGLDLLAPPAHPSYWVPKLSITTEYRVHIFKRGEEYVSVRAGTKVPRIDTPHEWVRSWTGGWKISYGNPTNPVSQAVREAAKLAVKALGMDFGAVDLGIVEGKVVVLEVNCRPGLEGGTIERYAMEFASMVKE